MSSNTLTETTGSDIYELKFNDLDIMEDCPARELAKAACLKTISGYSAAEIFEIVTIYSKPTSEMRGGDDRSFFNTEEYTVG